MTDKTGPKKTADGGQNICRLRQGGPQYADPAAQEVYDNHMFLISQAKRYSFILYGSHDFLNEVLELLTVAPNLRAISSCLYAYQEARDDAALYDINPKLASLVYEEKKKRSKAFIACKTNLILAVVRSLWCLRFLKANIIRGAIWEHGRASHYLGCCAGIGAVLFGDETAAALSRRGAAAKLMKDPRQHEKQLVRDCWDLWRAEPSRYTSKAEFARDMLDKFEALKSQTTIVRWCTTWEREDAANV